MTISEERKNGIEDIRNECMRVTQRASNEIRRRESRGLTRLQALTGLTREIFEGNLNAICSPPPPGSHVARRPSAMALNETLLYLNNARSALSTLSPIPSAPILNSRANVLNLGNAVRNLEPDLSVPRPPNQLIATAKNGTSLRTVSSNCIQNLRHHLNFRRRNANERERTSDPQRNANERERTPLLRGILIHPERTPPRRKVVNDPERMLPLGGIANDRERQSSPRPPPRRTANALVKPPPPRRNAIDSEKTPPPPPPPGLPPQHDPNVPMDKRDPETFHPLGLTFEEALIDMSSFNIDNEAEYKLIRKSLLYFSIKIYGLERCAKEDFGPSVLRFIEQYFNIRPTIKLCVRPVRDYKAKDVVGVLFEKCETVNLILATANVLRDTRYRVKRNKHCYWIILYYRP